MENFEEDVLVGNFLIKPQILRQILKKACYGLTFDPKKETLVFEMTENGGKKIFELRNVSYENAKKLAEGLGLTPGRSRTVWSKYNPKLTIFDNGCKEAQILKTEIVNLKIPLEVWEGDIFSLLNGNIQYDFPMWSLKKLIDLVRDVAERNVDELNSLP